METMVPLLSLYLNVWQTTWGVILRRVACHGVSGVGNPASRPEEDSLLWKALSN